MKRPLHLSFLTVLLFVATCFIPAFVVAAAPAVHLTPKPQWILPCKPYDKKPSLRTVQNGYFFSLIEEQIHVEKQASYNHIIREIVSEAGIQNGSQISVSFDPTFERLDFHEIVVWRNNKPINRLKLSTFKVLADEKELSSFIYQGSYSALYILDDIRKGDRIEFAYTLTGSNPIFNNKLSQMIYFQGYQPIAHQFTSLIHADTRKVNIKNFNDVPKAVVSNAGGVKTYVWESFQVPAGKENDLAPGWLNNYAYVQVSDFASWNEVAEWANKINPAATTLTGELKEEVAKLKAASGTDAEKYFRNAVTAVQDEVRYMGIEIGQYSHRANNPSKVFAQRYGDCKDKSLLLVSLLRAGGIDAWMVLVSTYKKDRVADFLPGHNLFDHAVVMAQVNGGPVWVDATMSYQRGTGTNIYFPNYGKGLVLKPGTTGLTAVTPAKTGKVVSNEVYTVTSENRPAEFKVTTIYTLNQADATRERLASNSMVETEKSYLEYYAKLYPKIEAVDSITVIDDEKANKLITIEDYKIPDFLKKDSLTGKYDASFYANYVNEQLPDVNAQVKTPVAVGFPYNVDQNIMVVLPGGWDIKSRKKSIDRAAYEFASRVSVEGDTLKLNYHLAFLQNFVPADKLDELRKDVKQIANKELSYSFTYTPDGVELPFNLNVWLVVYLGVVFATLCALAIWIYTRETPGILFAFGAGFVPLGGWLILPLIGLFLTPIIYTVSLFSDDYFNMATWYKYDNTGLSTRYKIAFIFEATGYVFLACYAVFCLVMYINRRDILPRYIVGYFIGSIVFVILDNALATGFSDDADADKTFTGIFRALLVCGIWIMYFLRSVRVQETFIVPHPPNNYRYESYTESAESKEQVS